MRRPVSNQLFAFDWRSIPRIHETNLEMVNKGNIIPKFVRSDGKLQAIAP